MCLPKEYGGLGLLETRIMNEALLGKWGWRLLIANKEDQCVKLLRRKYLRKRSFLQCSSKDGSQFWKGVVQTKDILKWGVQAKVNNGQQVIFWEDIWVGCIPLKLEFPTLY